MGTPWAELFIAPDLLPGCHVETNLSANTSLTSCDLLFSTADSIWGLFQTLSLMAVYGFVLFHASNMLSNGSELLLLVPSLEGIVGSVVLPILGAVPDGAIMLFSGLGDRAEAQEQLAVGVGALAGSTIMLLTIPWGVSIIAGEWLQPSLVFLSLSSSCGMWDQVGSGLTQMGVRDTRQGSQMSIALLYCAPSCVTTMRPHSVELASRLQRRSVLMPS